MKRIPKISDTEWEVMRVIWAHHPITAADVIVRLTAADSTWHPKTARTLLARLVAKEALGFVESGRGYVYSPRVTEANCIAAASGSFLERVFGGALQPMVAHFVAQRRLTPEELADLRAILEQTPPAKRSAGQRKRKQP